MKANEMTNQEIKEAVNLIIFECKTREMKEDEKLVCKTRIRRIRDEIEFLQREKAWIEGALANER